MGVEGPRRCASSCPTAPCASPTAASSATTPNDGNFVADGLVSAELAPHPAMREVALGASPGGGHAAARRQLHDRQPAVVHRAGLAAGDAGSTSSTVCASRRGGLSRSRRSATVLGHAAAALRRGRRPRERRQPTDRPLGDTSRHVVGPGGPSRRMGPDHDARAPTRHAPHRRVAAAPNRSLIFSSSAPRAEPLAGADRQRRFQADARARSAAAHRRPGVAALAGGRRRSSRPPRISSATGSRSTDDRVRRRAIDHVGRGAGRARRTCRASA